MATTDIPMTDPHFWCGAVGWICPTGEHSDSRGPEYAGPYHPDNGQCSNGHPVNVWGRCEPLNGPGGCQP